MTPDTTTIHSLLTDATQQVPTLARACGLDRQRPVDALVTLKGHGRAACVDVTVDGREGAGG